MKLFFATLLVGALFTALSMFVYALTGIAGQIALLLILVFVAGVLILIGKTS